MKPLTSEWVAKAEGDFVTASREFLVRENANFDAVCFHAQQCAEKYLKARLQEDDIPFPKTHDLAVLIDALLPSEPGWRSIRAQVVALTALAVDVRYPGVTADRSIAEKAVGTSSDVRARVRGSLGLDGGPTP